MCIKNVSGQKAVLVAASIAVATAVPAFFVGAAVEHSKQGQVAKTLDQATSAGSGAVVSYLRTKMPNTPWNGVAPDPDMPALYDVSADGLQQNAVYFDPKRKYLVIGVVVNMENPRQMIGGGHYSGPGGDAPAATAGGGAK